MKIARKHALGLGCLAIVGAITAFAFTLPTGAVSVGGSVEIMVEVYASNSETQINKPQDGEIFSESKITFSETHSHANSVSYYLTKLNSDGTVASKVEIVEQKIEGTDVSGTSTFDLDMNNYGGTGVYIFESKLIGVDGTTHTDHVQFTYAAISAEEPVVSPTGATVKYRVNYTPGVKSLTYQLFDSKNNAISEPITINTTDPDAGGYMDIEIDVTNLDMDSGSYQILTIGHSEKDGAGQTIGSDLVKFDYTAPDSPDVPDTGSLLASLNISRADYLITGIIGFTAISAAALFVVLKSKRNH
ncbi:hypothetical protein IJH10_03005 [Candidatus Saccharibacteria bacterium]|nr:hypothetical protein [Candidatus Saccharibacteria bacterium]